MSVPHFDTLALHAGAAPDPATGARATPIYQTTSFVFSDADQAAALFNMERAGHVYSRISNPTNAVFEERMAALENGVGAISTASGQAALHLAIATLMGAGSHIVASSALYGGSHNLLHYTMRRFGIETTFVRPGDIDGWRAAVRPQTRLLFGETLGNPGLDVLDIPRVAQIAHDAGVPLLVDSTFTTPWLIRPFDHGVDISVQALTKYQSGGSDVLMGSVVSVDDDLHHRLKQARMRMGVGVSADDCSLVLRSLPSMRLRFEAHDRAAMTLATWLNSRHEIAAMLHPAFEDCPGHACFRRDFTGAGGLFSVVFDERYSQAQIDAFIEGLRLFKIGFSWGGAHSLVVPYRVSSMRTATPWVHKGSLVRFYVGLEDVRDLQADIEASLKAHLGA